MSILTLISTILTGFLEIDFVSKTVYFLVAVIIIKVTYSSALSQMKIK